LTLNIAIAGGGIAGLTAALAFSKNGHSTTVFERAAALEDIGAGIQLSPNANKALSGLGLADAVKAISFEPEILQLVNGKSGRALSTLPFEAMITKRYGAPYLVVHRGDLQSILLDATKANPLIKIETGTLIDRFKNVADGVEIAGQKYDALIAADGIHSALRGQIDPNAKVIIDGQTAWRATLPLPDSTEQAVRVYMNAGAHLVAYRMGQRPELNLVFVSNSSQTPTGTAFGGPARDLITQAQNWKAWPLASVESQSWHNGRAIMIGDAAHAMTPHAAQGGAMAIEDAAVLASCLESQSKIEATFATFQAQRQPRLARVAALSTQNRSIYQMGSVMALGRNAVMPVMPPAILLRRLDWLYGCDGVSPD
jgi:salicylate hydroxylase